MKKGALFLLTIVIIFTAVSLLITSPVAAACGGPAGPGVDWSGCDKSGVNISGLDLSGAILVGTNLANANLMTSNLTGADLTNAIVTNMQVFQTNFTDATLFGATGTPQYYAWATYDHTICPSGILSNYTPNNMCYALVTAATLHASSPRNLNTPIAAVAPLFLPSALYGLSGATENGNALKRNAPVSELKPT